MPGWIRAQRDGIMSIRDVIHNSWQVIKHCVLHQYHHSLVDGESHRQSHVSHCNRDHWGGTRSTRRVPWHGHKLHTAGASSGTKKKTQTVAHLPHIHHQHMLHILQCHHGYQITERWISAFVRKVFWFCICSGLLLLEEIICSENDPDCLSLLCPSSMSYNHQSERCESGDQNIAVLGVVGNIKQMCREGFVWVDWKGQCLRRN